MRRRGSVGWPRRPPPWLLLWGFWLGLLVTRAGAFHFPRPQPLHRPWRRRPLLVPPLPAAPSPSDPPTAPPPAMAADTVAGLATQVRKAARAKPTDNGGHEALRVLTDRLAAALKPRSSSSGRSRGPGRSSSKNKKKHKGGSGSHDHPPPLRLETRRLVLAAVGDCARVNADPGPVFWPALGQWLHPVANLPTGELAALALALATLDVPLAAQPLWEELVAAVAHRAKGVGAREAGQLRKALTLLLGPGGGFRVGPQPTLAWLLPLLRAREEQDGVSEEEGPRALLTRRREQGRVRRPVLAAASSTNSGTAATSTTATTTTFSALHRRLLDLLQGAGCAVEAEVAYQGLNLDIVLYPPPARTGLLKPLVIEVDGPQHFLQGDPARPTGATAARRRLLRAATDAFGGLVSITYADEGAVEGGAEDGGGDEGSSSPRGRLLALLEREAEAQTGVSLAAYRIDGGDGDGGAAETGQWFLARRCLLAPSPEALVAEVRACEAEMDAGAWAVAVGRMGGFLRHGHRFHGRSAAARAARRGLLIGDPGGVLRSEQQALGLVAAASFPALGTLLGALADYYGGERQEDRAAALALAVAAVQRLEALLLQQSSSSSSSSSSSEHEATATPTALVTILRALAALGYRVGPDDNGPSSPRPLHQRLLPLLATKAGQDRLDAHGLASLLASLGRILHPLPPSAHSHLTALCAAAERRLPNARRTDLLLLAQGLAGLRRSAFSPPDAFTTALVAAAGRAAPALPLVPALALLTLREPAAGDDDGGNGDLMSQRERRRTPQWALVGEVRARLRALSPAGLVQALADVAGGEEGMDADADGDDASSYMPPPRAFLVMLCSEVYKRRDQLSARERARAVGVLRGSRLRAIYDPGQRFWQRMGSD